ncbi:LEA type 2 family protein [Haloplanus ruber]|uniref:LEA type 2 family protein n=1 Tax=Haloplanus ruber TaxID=869892 RepID=A0ABD6D3L6_9EURY|nr:LEA type 2 family protein [Haloplanus ruber]
MPSKRNVAIGVAGVVLLAGIAVFVLGQPSVSGVDNRFGGVNETTTVVESDLSVRNPNPIGASLGGLTVDYAIDMNGIRMATGVKEGLSLPSGESTVPMTTHLANERIPAWWVSHLDNGERTELAITADVHSSALDTSFGTPQVTRTVETDVISAFNSTERRPVGEEGPNGEPILYIEETSAQWGAIDSSATEIEMRFVVYNPNPYPVPVSELSYRATMNGVEMGTGVTEGQGTVPPESTRTIRATTVLDNGNIDEWWVTHLENDQRTELRIDFSARVELPTGTVEIPLRPLTYTETIETDLFGNKNETDAGGEATPTQGAEVTPTPTSASDGERTTTPTPTDDGLLDGGEETATPTPADDERTTTPTPTDGGLLDGGEVTATPTPADDERTTTPTPTDDGLLDARPPHGSIRARSDH